jgi:hypothetical protein
MIGAMRSRQAAKASAGSRVSVVKFRVGTIVTRPEKPRIGEAFKLSTTCA